MVKKEGSVHEGITTIQISKKLKRKLIHIKNNKGYKTIEEAILKG